MFSPCGVSRLGTPAGMYTVSPGTSVMRAGSRSAKAISPSPAIWMSTWSASLTR